LFRNFSTIAAPQGSVREILLTSPKDFLARVRKMLAALLAYKPLSDSLLINCSKHTPPAAAAS